VTLCTLRRYDAQNLPRLTSATLHFHFNQLLPLRGEQRCSERLLTDAIGYSDKQLFYCAAISAKWI
jgi:hypothetical protein